MSAPLSPGSLPAELLALILASDCAAHPPRRLTVASACAEVVTIESSLARYRIDVGVLVGPESIALHRNTPTHFDKSWGNVLRNSDWTRSNLGDPAVVNACSESWLRLHIDLLAGLISHVVTRRTLGDTLIIDLAGRRREYIEVDLGARIASASGPTIDNDTSRRATRDPLRSSSATSILKAEPSLIASHFGYLRGEARIRLEQPTNAVIDGVSVVGDPEQPRTAAWGGHTNILRKSRSIAYIEGLERIAPSNFENQIVTICARECDLKGDTVSPADVLVEGVHSGRDPERKYRSDSRIAWAIGDLLGTPQRSCIALELAAYDAVDHEQCFVLGNSSGVSTGSSLAEAQLHGIFELVERDSFLLAWSLRSRRRSLVVDRNSATDLQLTVLRLRLLGFQVRLIDVTSDLGLPAVVAVATDSSGTVGGCVGAGCSISYERAARAALAEVSTDAPFLERRLSARRTEISRMHADVSLVQSMADHSDLYTSPLRRDSLEEFSCAPEEIDLSDAAREVPPCGWSEEDISTEEHLEAVIQRLCEFDLKFRSVDISTSIQRSLGLSCVSVICPGLLPLDFGFSRQRFSKKERFLEKSAHFRTQVCTDPHPFP